MGVFAGDLAKRRRAKFVPGEAAAKVVQTKEPQHKDDFDEWLARIICFAFSVPPQWAVKAMNRATADNQSAQSEEEGLEPTKEWVKDLIDEIITEEFSSPDLELHWLDEDDGDPETVLADRLKLGAVTLNELRDHLGLDPYANPAADRPMVLTPTGYVPIEANAGVGGEGGGVSAQSTSAPIKKAAADDPKHPGWPAGTPDGKGGQFRPKDGGDLSGDTANDAEQNRPVQYAAAGENDAPANDNLTPEETCRRAYAIGMAAARVNPSLSPDGYLDARYQLTQALDICLNYATGVHATPRDGAFVEFFGTGGAVRKAVGICVAQSPRH